jgi:galactokinase
MPRTRVTNDATDRLREIFTNRFSASPQIYRAPGRVNLIGEHTDYNDGFVMPAAVEFFTHVAISPRDDRQLVIRSENYQEQVEYSLEHLPAHGKQHWSDYVVGVAKILQESGLACPGANLLIDGNVPQGAGLSSSASLEVAVATALLEGFALPMTSKELALICQRAENEFVGARCGIMDQFISRHGKSDSALLLDCRSLEYRVLPLPRDVRLVICNTMIRHQIAHGEYNQRRAQCEEGARLLAQQIPNVSALRDVAESQFEALAGNLPEVIRKRCRHVITENARVLRAGVALEGHDLEQFGLLMKESHESLRDDFEVSCAELDTMVELAGGVQGVYGSRMTGGGFGGCTVNLVREESVDTFVNAVREGYKKAVGIDPEIYVCFAADGACKLA